MVGARFSGTLLPMWQSAAGTQPSSAASTPTPTIPLTVSFPQVHGGAGDGVRIVAPPPLPATASNQPALDAVAALANALDALTQSVSSTTTTSRPTASVRPGVMLARVISGTAEEVVEHYDAA